MGQRTDRTHSEREKKKRKHRSQKYTKKRKNSLARYWKLGVICGARWEEIQRLIQRDKKRRHSDRAAARLAKRAEGDGTLRPSV